MNNRTTEIIRQAALGDTPKYRNSLGHWFEWVPLATDYDSAMSIFCKYFPGTGCGDALRFRFISENHQRMFMLLVALAEGERK
jgi:hypothetical protein